MIRPDKIISGGQTGADQGALAAAKELGIPTGGWMPRGFLTELGPNPSLEDLYGMQEHPSANYPPRTRQNVFDADGTIWISAENAPPSRGKMATYREVERYAKPFLNNPTPQILLGWMAQWDIRILNVAGPRASHDPMAHQRAATLILTAFSNGTP
jgi:hypothetical protein